MERNESGSEGDAMKHVGRMKKRNDWWNEEPENICQGKRWYGHVMRRKQGQRKRLVDGVSESKKLDHKVGQEETCVDDIVVLDLSTGGENKDMKWFEHLE